MKPSLFSQSTVAIIVCTLLALSSLISQDARAQSPSVTSSAFLTNPGQVLTQNANGGAQLVTLIRNLAVGDPTTLSTILALLPNANKDQKAAIAAGLAQAAKVVLKANPVYANDIQQSIAQTKDQDVVLAFAAASGDQPTGTTGGGAGVAGGASGGQTASTSNGASGSGSLQPIGQPGVNTGAFAISSSVTGAQAPTTGTGAISRSVSP